MKIAKWITKFFTTCLHPNAISKWIELGHPAKSHLKDLLQSFKMVMDFARFSHCLDVKHWRKSCSLFFFFFFFLFLPKLQTFYQLLILFRIAQFCNLEWFRNAPSECGSHGLLLVYDSRDGDALSVVKPLLERVSGTINFTRYRFVFYAVNPSIDLHTERGPR